MPLPIRPLPFALLGLFAAGCGPSGPGPAADTARRSAAADPWPKAVAALRKDTDPATCRRVLGQLNAELTAAPEADQPAGLSAADEAALKGKVPLTDDDLAEVRPAGFTPLDGPYLADSFYLRDCARALDVAGLPPAERAAAAFAWVCRQVELRPWATPVGNGRARPNPPLPPVHVLLRGSGSGLERAFVFLALAQQLDLDVCLVGDREAADRPGLFTPQDAPAGAFPKGPFWAVGVRVGVETLVFDPWRDTPSEPVPLAKLASDPDRLKPWGVSAEAAKAAVTYAAVPASALASRMRLLQDKLGAEAGVRLAATLAGPVWNPAGDPYTPTRALANFLPVDDGGRDSRPGGQRLLDLYMLDQFPRSLAVRPDGLTAEEVVGRLRLMALGAYEQAFVARPSPRERIQRGRYGEAAGHLVQTRDRFRAAGERVRTDRARDDARVQFVREANKVYADLARARLDERTDPGAVAAAQQGVERFWHNGAASAAALVDAAVDDPGLGEATYLLALAKHEAAERAARRLARAPAGPDREAAAAAARSAADTAREWWGVYEPLAAGQDRDFPGRAAHARGLAERWR